MRIRPSRHGPLGLTHTPGVGDCYMSVGGLPEPRSDHAERVASAALGMLPTLSTLVSRLDLPLSVRIGLHSGDVVAGVIVR